MQNKILAFDMDDVICVRPKSYEHLGVEKYKYAQPIQPMIDIINKLHTDNKIIIYTARGMSQFYGDILKVYTKLYDITYNQLIEWDVAFDELIMGKIHYDLLIDDKVLNSRNILRLQDIEKEMAC